MKKVIFLFSMLLSVSMFAHNGLETVKPTVIVAPPASSLAMTALQESPAFDKVFRNIVGNATKTFYDNNWNAGSQNPNSIEGRRLAFAVLILKGDLNTIQTCKSFLLNTSFSYNLADDATFKDEIRTNFDSNFDALAKAF